MLTSTHALAGMAAFSKRGEKGRNRWVLVGSLIPDAAVFIWAPWQRWGLGRDWPAIWNQHYFEAPMQTLVASMNSIPIYVALALFGCIIWRAATPQRAWGLGLALFAGAALLHIALDAPVHASDAYRHFWPLSDWRFYSPLSYWEIDHHSRVVSVLEAGIVAVCAVVLWRRFPATWARALVVLLLMATLLNAGAQQLAAINIAS